MLTTAAEAHDIATRKLCLDLSISTADATADATFASRGTALRNAMGIWEESALASTSDVYSVWLHSEDRQIVCDRAVNPDGSQGEHICVLAATPCRSEWFLLEAADGSMRVYDYQYVGFEGLELDGSVRLPQATTVLSSAARCPGQIDVREAGRISFYRDEENYLVLCGTDEQLGLMPVPEGDRLATGLRYPAGALRLEPWGEPVGGEYAATDTDRQPGGHLIDGRIRVGME
jgi:hypothetical protein